MDELVIISKSNTRPIMLEIVDLHMKSASKNSTIYRFHFLGSSSFPLSKFWTLCFF